MYEYDELIQELQEDGYTPEDIEDYIRNEVDKDKVEKYKELDKAKITFFIFLIGMIGVEAFKEAKVQLTTLSNYDAVLEEAVRTDYIDESEIAILQEWRKDPSNWDPNKK